MKIDKAIKILTEWHWPDSKHPWNDTEAAIKLGIEALKRVKVARLSKALCPRGTLPGETT